MNQKPPKHQISDHYDGKLFFNPGVNVDKSFLDLLKWQRHSNRKTWPTWVENTHTPQVQAAVLGNDVELTFINHVTFLIQTQGLNILTDPVFSERTSPVQWLGPKRVRRPGLAFEQLPKIDLVLVSHNHYDHMDMDSLERLRVKYDPVFIMPLGNKRYMPKRHQTKVKELDWWQTEICQTHQIHLTPAQHWSARGIFDRRQALWGGFLIQGTKMKTYFAGDSGYGPCFKQIQEKLGSPDLALLPIGAYEPRWMMKPSHMNPSEAVQAHLDLKAKKSIAMHFGTWQLTDEGFDDPESDLKIAKAENKISDERFLVMGVGETRRFTGAE